MRKENWLENNIIQRYIRTKWSVGDQRRSWIEDIMELIALNINETVGITEGRQWWNYVLGTAEPLGR